MKIGKFDADLLTWNYAIAEARRGRAGDLAKLLTDRASALPAELVADVRNVVAHPVHAKRTGGRPPKVTRNQVRWIRDVFSAFTTDFPADDDGPAFFAWPKPRAITKIADDLELDEATVRAMVNRRKPYDYD